MLFMKPLCLLFGLLSYPLSIHAASDAAKLTDSLNSASELVQSTVAVAQSITIVNSFQTFPQLIQNHQQLIQKLADSVSSSADRYNIVINIEVGGPTARINKFRSNAQDQENLAVAWRQFAYVLSNLMEVEIGKADLAKLLPFAAPTLQTLRVLEGGVDTAGFQAIDLLGKYAGDATKDKEKVDDALARAIDAYNF